MDQNQNRIYGISQNDAQFFLKLVSENAKEATGQVIQQYFINICVPLKKTTCGYELEKHKNEDHK